MQSVQYFQRALKLNKRCLSAWTLMGHEYLELKNPAAAIGVLHWSPHALFCGRGLTVPCSEGRAACRLASTDSG